MSTRSIRSQLVKQFPTIHSVKMGSGSMRGTLLIQGAEWETKEAIKAAASAMVFGVDILVIQR